MGCIQLALSDNAKADALRVMLSRTTHVPVRCVETPDYEDACVVVVDDARFDALSLKAHADRVILISDNEPHHIREAWDAGLSSVLSDQDPLNTVVLAVLAVCLRAGSARQKPIAGRACFP